MPRWRDVSGSLRPIDLRGAAFLGLILGLSAFWNGALTISALLILGAAIVWARRRGDLIICCGIATLLAILETRFFIRSGPAVAPHLHFGFLAGAPTPGGVLSYYLFLLGLLVPLLVVAFWVLQPAGRWFLVSLLVPIAFATTFTFTPDIAVNHKFVNVSVRLAAIVVALLIVRLFDNGRIARSMGVALCFALTATGVVDFIALWNWNDEKRTHNLADPMLQWAMRETDPRAVFAAPPVYHHLVYLSGRRSYLGLPYWAESAGYDVPRRLSLLTRIYEGGNPEEIARIAESEGISYVIVDDIARAHFVHLREDAFVNRFPLAFNQGRTQVYALHP
jgi:hypothetical protein